MHSNGAALSFFKGTTAIRQLICVLKKQET